MTSDQHQSGTDRCAEALSVFQSTFKETVDVVINIQGDEPFISPLQIEKLKECFHSGRSQIATLVKPIHEKELFDPNHVKVVLNKRKEAMYFSRSAIPYLRGKEQAIWHEHFNYNKHIGIYAYRASVLKELTLLKPSTLELAESLEQLRWLENGFQIAVEFTDFDSISVDTPADLEEKECLTYS